MEHSPLDKYCGSRFWNTTLTWDTEEPELTECFQNTVLVWIPCLFLWIFACFEVSYIVYSKHQNVPWNILNVSKLLITSLLIILNLTDLATAAAEKETLYKVYIYSPIIKAVSYVLSALLLVCNRKCGLRTSGLQFIFWLLMALCTIPQVRSQIAAFLQKEPEFEYPFISCMVHYALVLLMLLLNCFADKPPQKTKYLKPENPCPEDDVSFLRRIFYQWFDSLIWKGFKKPLEASDLWSVRHEDSSEEVVPLFNKYWQKCLEEAEKARPQYPRAEFKSNSGRIDFVDDGKKKEVSVLLSLCKGFGPAFLFGVMLKLIQTTLIFVSPQILKMLITFTENKEPQWRGYFYVACMFATNVLNTLISSQYTQRMSVVGMRIRTALISVVYRKALRLSNAAKKEGSMGEMVNLMAVDAQMFSELLPYINIVWSAPLEIALALYFLWQILGPSVLAGLAIMVALIPVNGAIAKRMSVIQIAQMANKDERIKLINEMLNGIRVLKLYAWEPSFEAKISKIRNKEVQLLKQAAFVHSGMSFIYSCAPYLVTLLSFITFIYSDEENVLTPQVAFVSLTLFATMHFVMGVFPMVVIWVTEAKVSLNRINKFVNLEELDPDNVEHDPSASEPIIIERGNFSWDEDVILKNISMEVTNGSLVAIVGSVGSGKSSLISALLGEMNKISGRVNTIGSIAYVAQQAWIQNATIQDNITFGRAMDAASYEKIIEACALKQDFDMLPGGDKTEIGEKGVNISGGQKQRISIARAVYTNADIYLLDDPLSAVDSHVGKHIFDNVIGPQGILKNSTRVLVTHSITYLPMVDRIVVLKDGTISEAGTYRELMDKKGAFADYLSQYLNETIEEAKESEAVNSKKGSESAEETAVEKINGVADEKTEDEETTEKLIEAEKMETGSVKWAVYKYYFQCIGFFFALAMVLFNILIQVFNIGSNLWLSAWSVDQNVTSSQQDVYLSVYGVLGFGQVASTFFAALVVFIGALNGASLLHNLLLSNILKAPCNIFFDVTPVGRILNRFSQDIGTVDSTLPMYIRGFNNCFFGVLNTFFVISYTTPIFIVVIIPLSILYYFVRKFYVTTSRQLNRIEPVTRSPIYSHFSETVAGASAIRAYGVSKRFIKESEEKVDFNQACNYPVIIASRWLSVRLEMIGNLVILFAALFAVIDKEQNPGLVGLSIAYALQITQSLNLLVEMSSDIESNIVSVERIKEYEETPREAPWDIPKAAPPLTWPDDGAIAFKNFSLRYRPGLDLVLKDINIFINGGEKIGVVGRTGSGKTTLMLSLFRIIEASEGEILIDGVNIAGMGLHALRSRLTIIPQDPVLFSGNLKMNLDPFEKHSDEEIWKSLEHARLKEFVQGLPAGLNHEITEGGENLSVGQRQLVCLSRALLRKTKVLVLDEATAAIDLETDDFVQRTIRSEFKNSTILTIAHRLNTVLDSDKIIVLDRGCIVEFDSPRNLLKNRHSVFFSMAKDAGLV